MSAEPAERRRALVVANARYDDVDLDGLASPARDAAALTEVLADPARCGFEVATVVDGEGECGDRGGRGLPRRRRAERPAPPLLLLPRAQGRAGAALPRLPQHAPEPPALHRGLGGRRQRPPARLALAAQGAPARLLLRRRVREGDAGEGGRGRAHQRAVRRARSRRRDRFRLDPVRLRRRRAARLGDAPRASPPCSWTASQAARPTWTETAS